MLSRLGGVGEYLQATGKVFHYAHAGVRLAVHRNALGHQARVDGRTLPGE